jgi:2-polyprenyl-3-methyl-5-hydroxy-6-metoxy-1,4-benzoquinol methylase
MTTTNHSVLSQKDRDVTVLPVSASTLRNYTKEAEDHADRAYFYDFDARLRRYMLKTFSPWLRSGTMLEMGCYKGAFTKLLAERCPSLHVVEASRELIDEARKHVSPRVTFHESRFETFRPPIHYDSILLIHTLEHLDDPVEVLKQVSTWLSPQGRLIIAVPNANAPSRQLAVKMGLISHHTAVTVAEEAHGHRCTYTLDTLERDVRLAGFSVVSRGGVFFKPLANYQFDSLTQADMMSEAYLDACYELGMVYPDLCASVYVVCEPRQGD